MLQELERPNTGKRIARPEPLPAIIPESVHIFDHVTLAPAAPRLFGECFWDIVWESSMMKTSRCTHNNHMVGEEAIAFLFI